MSSFYKLSPYILSSAILAACGGGGGSSTAPTPAPTADTIPPVISLSGDTSVDVEQGTTFTDPGASATDNRDGSVTVTTSGTVDSNVAGTYTLTYTASDAAGNSASASRTVTVADTIAPVISLSGEAQENLPYGSAFSDDGASSADTVDGDVTVSVTGAVDTFMSGEYVLTYTAEDQAGNASTATRTINVGLPQAKLDVSVFGDGTVTSDDGTVLECNDVSTLCMASFVQGSVITLTASPTSNWDFNRWTACEQTDGTTCTITMDRDRTVLTGFLNQAPLVFEPGVFKLTDAQVADISGFRVDRNILTFNSGADLTNIEVGNIIYTDSTSDSEIYFAKRVEDIIPLSGSSTLVETINVSMDEMISEGTLSISPDLEIDEENLPKGVSLEKRVNAAGKTIPTLTFSSATIYERGGAKISVSGSLGLDLDPNVDLDFTLRDGLKSARVALEQSLDADLSFSVTGTFAEFQGGDGEISFSPIPLGAIPAGPFVFVVSVTPVANLSASLDVVIQPKITLDQEAIAGIQWHTGSGFTNLTDFGFDAGFDEGALLRGRFKTEATLGPKLDMKLYGVAGPTLDVRGIVGAKLEASAFAEECPYSFGLYAGGQFSAGGEIGVFSKKLAVNTKLFKVTTPLKSGKIFCDQDVTAPAEPSGVSATVVNPTQIDLSWFNVNSDLDIVSYEIWRRDTNFGRARLVATTDSPGYTDGNLQPENEYCYYIRTVDHAGNRSPIPSSGFVCTTTPEPEDIDPPTAPTGLVATSDSSSSIDLVWEDSTDNEGVAGYIVLNSTIEDAGTYQIGEAVQPGGKVSRLNGETEYCFNVVAIDLRGNVSDLSERVCATTLPKSESEWTAFIGCQGREFLLEEKLEIEASDNAAVELAASGNDYNGTALSYILAGVYQQETGLLDAEINWSFEGQSQVRQDQFEADLSTGDSGIVLMNQTRVTGCDAQIQFVQNPDEVTDAMKPVDVLSEASAISGRSGGLITRF